MEPIWEAEEMDVSALVADLKKACHEIALRFEWDFKSVTATWEHRPTWQRRVAMDRGDLVVDVFATRYADIFAWVDEGTEPHTILPRFPGYPLRFERDYTPKTARFILRSKPGGKSGPIVAAWRVEHPGIAPRYFTREILAKQQNWWRERIALIFWRHGVPYAGRAGRPGRVVFD